MSRELAPDVHEIEVLVKPDGRRYRAYLFADEAPTLIDVGYDRTAEALFSGLDEVGVAPERLLITHGDGDHAGAFDAVVDRFGLETYVHEASDFESRHAPDVRLSDGDALGGFTAVHTPGHAADHLAFVHEARGIAVLGDAVFGSDRRGLPPGHFILPAAFYSEDLNQADESLSKLLEYDFDVGLVSHGSSVLEGAGEKLDRFVID